MEKCPDNPCFCFRSMGVTLDNHKWTSLVYPCDIAKLKYNFATCGEGNVRSYKSFHDKKINASIKCGQEQVKLKRQSEAHWRTVVSHPKRSIQIVG